MRWALFEGKQCRKLGGEFVSREGSNNNDAARCHNKICLNDGGHPIGL